MLKVLRYLTIGVIVLILILGSFALRMDTVSPSTGPLAAIERFAETVTRRVSDIVYYLVMQKKYLFDDFTDPNIYPNWSDISKIDEVALQINATTTKSPPTNSGQLIVVDKPIIPAVRPTLTVSASSTLGRVASIVPGLVVKTQLPANNSPVPIETPSIIYTSSNDSEILSYTNKERLAHSVSALIEDATLDELASLRADDLFENQYFNHESPSGKSAPELAKKLGYNYLLIGENLALGTFDGEKGIVTAWMASEGHRENILNAQYSTLGVSVKQGIYNDQSATIAVQIFATPISNCPRPSSKTKELIDSATVNLIDMQSQAVIMYASLELIRTSPDLDNSYYNQKVQEYNYFAKNINDAILGLKNIVDNYNFEVGEYNACINRIK